MDKESEGFAYLRQEFPKISEAKMKEGIFIGPQITQLFEDQDFTTKLYATERRAWKALENVCRNFLGNEKVESRSNVKSIRVTRSFNREAFFFLILICQHQCTTFNFWMTGSVLNISAWCMYSVGIVWTENIK